ncbi:hypothetical protein AAC387_Pa03g3091 [Persea americana]
MKTGKFLHDLLKLFASRSEKSPASDSESKEGEEEEEEDINEITAHEQKQFPLETLVAATQGFHSKNKLGEGGFGPVYKGKLEDGREIAVKKLARGSNQGRKEFANEARLLSLVQHRNVVSLLGYCACGSQKLLVYEYVANESLDKFLFKNDGKRGELDWKRRYDAIVGVARGLLYLHEDSHCRIIHRDIKASNILLDDQWVAKIADFGMARLFPDDQPHIKTRVAGTSGYMAPEYVMHGELSVKADVFSFGVLVLELISGKRNSTFNSELDGQNLLQWVWKLYNLGQALEIMDPTLASTAAPDQVSICIQIGLLCAQADPKLRPTMRRAVVMLSKKPGTLEEPMRPGYPGSLFRRSHRASGRLLCDEHPSAASVSASNPDTTSTSTFREEKNISPKRPEET